MKIYKNLDINNLENEIWKIIENFSDYQENLEKNEY